MEHLRNFLDAIQQLGIPTKTHYAVVNWLVCHKFLTPLKLEYKLVVIGGLPNHFKAKLEVHTPSLHNSKVGTHELWCTQVHLLSALK